MKTQNLNWRIMKQTRFKFDGKLERVNLKAPHYCEGQELDNSLSFTRLGHERWSALWCSSVPPPLMFSSLMLKSSLGRWDYLQGIIFLKHFLISSFASGWPKIVWPQVATKLLVEGEDILVLHPLPTSSTSSFC